MDLASFRSFVVGLTILVQIAGQSIIPTRPSVGVMTSPRVRGTIEKSGKASRSNTSW